jgi:hypothetical protein
MAESPSVALQRAIRQQVVAALGRLRDEAEAAGALAALGPAGPEWAMTALDGHLLAPLGALAVADQFAAAVLAALRGVTGGKAGTAVTALHGWQDVPGGPRGIAFAGRVGGGGDADSLAFALHVSPSPDGPRLGLTASGAAAQPVTVRLNASWTLIVSGSVGGALRLVLDPATGAFSVQQGGDGDHVEGELRRVDDLRTLGVPGGPAVVLGSAAVGAQVSVDGGRVVWQAWMRLPGASAQVAPAAFARLVPALGPVPLAVDLGFADAGMTLGGSTELAVRLPVGVSVPGAALESVDLAVRPGGAGDAAVVFAVRLAVRVSVPGSPLALRLTGLGLEVPAAFGDVPVRGVDPGGIISVPAAGAGVEVDLPIVRAGGFLGQGRPGEYAGALSATVPPMSAAAYAVLGISPLSFVVLLSATFPPPGVQIGFGFAVRGIGGVVGVGRRVDRSALLRAVSDGTAAQLLFPTDPSAAAGQVGGALAAIFPPARGAVLAGPMFQVSWGGRIVTASVAVLMEVAPTPRMTVIGTLVVVLPDPVVPLVLIQATFAGQFDPTEPGVLVVASMHGSHIVGMPITGEVCLLTRGGRDATFVLSAGGFHPAFPLPRGVPPLERIGTDLSPLPLLELRAEAYFAVTSNTIQFGARIELVAEVAECGLRGHLGLDVLVQRDPFRFVAAVSIGIALTVVGEELVGVALDFTLEGPARWRARGRGSVDLFLFSVSFDFDEEWGSAPPLPHPAPDVGAELAAALAAPGAWVVHRAATGLPGLALTPDADRALGRGEIVDPYASLTVRQRRVPLGIAIDRFDRLPLGVRQTWDVVDGRLGDVPAPGQAEVREQFAAAGFLGMTDDEQLARPAYEPFRAGLDLMPAGVVADELTPHTIVPETKVIADPLLPSMRVHIGDLSILAAEVIAASTGVEHPLWWPRATDVITVAEQVPLAVAGTWGMTPEPIAAGGTATELYQAIEDSGRHDLMVVEAWETAS